MGLGYTTKFMQQQAYAHGWFANGNRHVVIDSERLL